MSIADQLTQLNQVKSGIKQALIDKGVDMADVPFTQYAEKIMINGKAKMIFATSSIDANSGVSSQQAISKVLELPQPVYVFNMAGRSYEYQGPNHNTHSQNVILQGSNDGKTWSDLLSVLNYMASDVGNGYTYSQTKMVETAYKFFRFVYKSEWYDSKQTWGSFRYCYVKE